MSFDYFNARYYDATIGRFINVDPVQDGANWYVYCGNNPLKLVDPSGLNPVQTVLQALQVGYVSPDPATTAVALLGTVLLAADAISGGEVSEEIGENVAAATIGNIELVQRVISEYTELQSKEKRYNDEGKTFQIYVKYNIDDDKIYIGRTSGYNDADTNVKNRDRNHHKDKYGYGEATLLYSTNSGVECRIIEEALITMLDSINMGGNDRHGIWPGYPYYKPLFKAAEDAAHDIIDTAKDVDIIP